MPAIIDITSHSCTGPERDGRRHTTHYLAAGPQDGPLLIFTHGWPELSISWRHQLPCFGALGFRAVAPDMRGYGRSSTYDTHADYALEHICADMCELHDHLGGAPAVWVGHDWGSPVAWSMAAHYPQRSRAVASLCVPYRTIELGLEHLCSLVNRERYPEHEFPAGQWEYMRFYEDNFEAARAAFEANPRNTAQLLFRKGDPATFGERAGTAFTRINGGWFGPEGAPVVPRDADVLTESDLDTYAESMQRNGFFGPDSWYMNHAANAAWTATVPNAGRLELPALFIAASYDTVCDAITSDLPRPMRAACTNLTECEIASGHWMAQEKPREVNAVLARWLATSVSDAWPQPAPRGG